MLLDIYMESFVNELGKDIIENASKNIDEESPIDVESEEVEEIQNAVEEKIKEPEKAIAKIPINNKIASINAPQKAVRFNDNITVINPQQVSQVAQSVIEKVKKYIPVSTVVFVLVLIGLGSYFYFEENKTKNKKHN